MRTAGVLAAVVLTATGCAGRVATVEPAPHATDPACAPAMLAMPDALGDHALRPTDSQATAVWGEPAAVVLRCGVQPPGPTTDRCIAADGVDWVVREEEDRWRLTTYGRTPAVEVLLSQTAVSSDTVMAGLASAVERIPAARGCVGLSDAAPVG
ncbi:DUF3515 family protein [Micrococcus sp.]|uniref:DUF3515 family protein n=1 Tax=Micrococcus sp. TaxID=1271 RepID=UPI002A90B87A|nr:DUF3515 family protein [Micrococcus sp.]MDY6055667.1 DUF3515 family protein [Micrococcus sp.]